MIRDLYLLEIFIDIADSLSFSKTAQTFNASQSFISKKISQLESTLQTSLLIRTTRTVKLSEDGKKILPIAIKILEDSDSLNRILSMNIDDKDVSGRISISASETYTSSRLVPLLSKFTRLFPNISIDLRLSNKYYDLASNEVDFVFRIGDLPDSSLKSIKIESNDLVFCTNPKLHKKIGANVNIEDLKDYPIMYLPFHGENKVTTGKKFVKLKNLFPKSDITVDSGEVMNHFAISSDRIALRSTWDIQRYIDQGSLKIIKTSNQVQSKSNVYILYSNREYIPQKMKIFLSFLRNEIFEGLSN